MGLPSLPISTEQLNKAYRKRAKELHPDRPAASRLRESSGPFGVWPEA